MLKTLTPGLNIGIGWDCFELGKGLISDVIVDIEKAGSPDLKTRFVPSHCWKVLAVGPVDNWSYTGVKDQYGVGIEASTEGVAYFGLSKYFDDPACEVWSCHPAGLHYESITSMLYLSAKLAAAKMGYDYAGLIGDAIEAFTGLDRLLPELFKVADPLHDRHALFCSALVSTLNSYCAQYQDLPLYKDYAISKISPEMAMWEFPYDQRILVKSAG